ncbi:cytoplasmic protein [Ephemerocybe angulata]|uniref:Cytoplasmic protein n=1 Tax=Ephemerocybe angulata TaxID=980116 RepID=A0A8H6HWG4_9AGAR|nr:cytoplasmic protein [Tulosesus angulatus]
MSLLRLSTLKHVRCTVGRFQGASPRFLATDAPRPLKAAKENPLTDVKPKPKEITPLRRSASASQVIRTNPTPTRGDINPVMTFSTSERYILSRLRQHPDLPPRAQALHESWWVPRWIGPNGREGEVFVFSNGSFVCWGLTEDDAKVFAQEVISRATGMEVNHFKEPETEELEFVVDPSEPTRLQGDLIILGQTSSLNEPELLPPNLPRMVFPEETLLARYAFSQALSRSTALSAMEVALEKYLASMASMPDELAKTGKPGMNRKSLIKKLGELMKFRQYLNLNRENFIEAPDFYWAEPELEKLFRSMSNALEVRNRTNALNDKITYAAEMQSMLRALLTESSGHSMELIIIALIAVEVVLAIIREGPELWHKITGSDEEESNLTTA